MSNSYTNKKRIFIPSNWEEIIETQVQVGKKIHKVRDCNHCKKLTKYLLHGCYSSEFFRDDGYPMHSLRASTICSGNNKILPALREAFEGLGIIICDNESKKGYKSFHYGLGKSMKSVDWRLSEHMESFKTLKSEAQQDREKRENLPRLEVDESILSAALSLAAKEKGWGKDKENRIAYWETQLTDNWRDVIIHQGKTGRIYGSWSNIPKELRGVFKIDGEKAVEVDIKSSQPTLLVLLYEDKCDPECQTFIRMIQDSECYEQIMDFTGIKDRNLVKKKTMEYLCGKVESNPEIKGFFSQKYPYLFTKISTIQKDYYKKLAWFLQKHEANIVVNNICKNYNVYSMHDGVICKESEAEEIQKAMRKALEAECGIKGIVTIEDKRAIIESHSANPSNLAA